MDMEKHAMDGASDGNNINHTSPSSCVDDNNKLYKGVRKRKWGKWVSEIRLPNSRERIWLGSYDSPEKAARAFDAALYCLRGSHANFNFPNTPCNMDTNVAVQSLTPQEIQEVAAKFANHDPLLLKPLYRECNNSSSDGGNGNSSPKSSNTIYTPTSTNTASSSSCSTTVMHECDGKVVQVDHGDMDWTFLNVFDYPNEVFPVEVPDYDIYSELNKIHSSSGELLYSTPPPFEGNQGFIESDDDPFSHQSFLWNWDF